MDLEIQRNSFTEFSLFRGSNRDVRALGTWWKNHSYAVLNGFPFPLALDCNFDRGGLCRGVSQNSNDKFDWRVRKGRTPSSGTGPSEDVSGTGRLAWSADLSRQLI